jgi:hypothetical protein
VTAAAIIAAAITPITSAAASKKEDEYDYQKNEAHRIPLAWAYLAWAGIA